MKGVKVIIDKVDETVRAMRALADKRVLVGIPSATTARGTIHTLIGTAADPAKFKISGTPTEAGINNAALGYIHEFGAPEANIPARPFLIPGVKNVENQTVASLKIAGRLALSGHPEQVDKELIVIGNRAVTAVNHRILTGPFEPLRPATIAARKRKGQHPPFRPLIDTGAMHKAISFVIRKV